MSATVDIQFEGVESLLEREYRNAPSYQWARELTMNSMESDADRIHFGVEWQGVEAEGVHRRLYVDNGHGMSREEIRDYMRTLGRGGKPVGGVHDNYAMGCRLTLLPWNRKGVVVISLKDGETNMVKMFFDQSVGRYVLEQVQWLDENDVEHYSEVYPPYYDEDLDIEWESVLPEWVIKAGHGTAFILLGNELNQHTIDGDPARKESHRAMGRVYLNTRFWADTGKDVSYLEYHSTNPANWPVSESDKSKMQNRTIRGAQHFYESFVSQQGVSILESSGVIEVEDANIYWYLRKPDSVDLGGMATDTGIMALLYRNELYDHVSSSSGKIIGSSKYGSTVYQSFGVSGKSVRDRLTIIIEPVEHDEALDNRGVAPSTGRADLYWIGGGKGAVAASVRDFAHKFADNMPDEIVDALVKDQSSPANAEDRRKRMQRVMDNFSNRWRQPRMVLKAAGEAAASAGEDEGWDRRTPVDTPAPTPGKPRIKKVRLSGRRTGKPDAPESPAEAVSATIGYPDVEWTTQDDIQDAEAAATWIEPNKAHPGGLIQLDKDSPIFCSQVDFWKSKYTAPAQVAQIEGIVREVYEDSIISKVSHVLSRTGSALSDADAARLLSNQALTFALHGLVTEDAIIGTRLGKLGRKQTGAVTVSTVPNGPVTVARN